VPRLDRTVTGIQSPSEEELLSKQGSFGEPEGKSLLTQVRVRTNTALLGQLTLIIRAM